jgi:hypothetical protein
MEEEIQVGMDGEWRSATPPDWLTTEGVASCIAVAVSSDYLQRAWLIHAHSFGHDSASLEAMLSDAASYHPWGVGLNAVILGGTPADANCESEAALAQAEVVRLIDSLVPKASVIYRWGQANLVEMIFYGGAWQCSCR